MTDGGQERRVKFKTARWLAAQEPLLYDPQRPAHAVLLRALPGKTTLDDQGNLGVKVGLAERLLLPGFLLFFLGMIRLMRHLFP